MIGLIGGTTHAGKTMLAQRLLERYHVTYLSLDHLKMGLIRSGYTNLTPMQDEELTAYLWPIVREMIKTNLENGQDLLVEGCYIPFDWQKDFTIVQRKHMHYICLVMSARYIRTHEQAIYDYESVVEKRQNGCDLNQDALISQHLEQMRLCRAYGLEMHCFDESYDVDVLLARCAKWFAS